MIRQWPNCIGFPNTDINLCLVWVFLRGPVRFREAQKAVLWSTHVVLPLEPRNRSWLCYWNAQNVGGFCWLSNALPGCVGSVAHTHVVSRCVVSCRAVSCRVVEQSWVRPSGGRTPLPWTAPGEPLIYYCPLAYNRNQNNTETQENVITQQTHCLQDSGLEVEPSVIWEGWGGFVLRLEKKSTVGDGNESFSSISAEDFKYKTRETETSKHILLYVFKKYSKGLKLILRMGIIITCFTEPNHLNVGELPLRL